MPVNLTVLSYNTIKIEREGRDDVYESKTNLRLTRNKNSGKITLRIGSEIIEVSDFSEIVIGGQTATDFNNFEIMIGFLFNNA